MTLDADLLRRAREESGLSQSDLAENLEISQTQVSRYEKDPEAIPSGLMLRWLQTVGIDPADAFRTGSSGDLAAEPGDPYADLRKNISLAIRYIDVQAPESLSSLDVSEEGPADDLPAAEDLRQELQTFRQKPNVMMAGGFDTGKSYLANTLLGQNVLPASFQPATRIITVVRHASDRPRWQDEDVWLFDKTIWKRGERRRIDIALLDDEARCADSRVLAGSHDLLHRYAVHRDDVTGEVRAKMERVHSAVVYAEAPVLKACNIVDLPGFGDRPAGESEDQQRAEEALSYADIVLYTSRIRGHLSGKDLSRISAILRQLPAPEERIDTFPTLGNFFLVATHADRSITNESVQDIQNKGITRLYQYLKEGALARREATTGRTIREEDLRQQWFPFWAENPERSRPLVVRLNDILGQHMPVVHSKTAHREIQSLLHRAEERSHKAAQFHRDIAQEHAEKRQRLTELKDEFGERIEKLQRERDDVKGFIQTLRKKSRARVEGVVRKRLDVDYIRKLIKRNFDEKTEAKERAPALVIEQIESNVEEIVAGLTEQLTGRVDEYLEHFQELALGPAPDTETSPSTLFDAKAAFAGGISGAATIGGLAAWTAQLGNLGGYVLVAKGVGALSSLGLSLSGGAAAASAAVAAIGGPITLALGIGSVVALGTWRLFSESWEERLARKISSHFKDENVERKFVEGIDTYWKNTEEAFDKGADAVEARFQDHVRQLDQATSSENQARALAETYESARNFYAGIPWSTPSTSDNS
jgi:transcriptional regulator with XRE-family HTH domain